MALFCCDPIRFSILYPNDPDPFEPQNLEELVTTVNHDDIALNDGHHNSAFCDAKIIAPESLIQNDQTNDRKLESKITLYEEESSWESDDSSTTDDSIDERIRRMIASIENGCHIGFKFDEDTGSHTIFALDSAFLERWNDEVEKINDGYRTCILTPVFLNANPLTPITPGSQVPLEEDNVTTQVDQEAEVEEVDLNDENCVVTPRHSEVKTLQYNARVVNRRAQSFDFALGRLEGRLMPESPSPIKRYVNSTGVFSSEVEIEFSDTRLRHPEPQRTSFHAGLLTQFELAAENALGSGNNSPTKHGNGFDELIDRPANPTPHRAKYQYSREI